MKPILKLLFVLAVFPLIFIALDRLAIAGQYDTALPLRTGTGAFILPGTGGTNSWQTLAVTGDNAVIQSNTDGTGYAINPGLQLAGTAAIALALGGTNTPTLPVGILGLSSSNTLAISTGTAQGFRNAP